MTSRYRSGHLGEFVDAYVDGELDAASSKKAARHLVACSACRRAVDAERAIVVQVRSVPLDPGRHARLVAGLVALDVPPADALDDRALPMFTSSERGVRVVASDSPAHYDRSARRSAIGVAALAVACGAIVVSNVGHARSTAPGGSSVSSVRGDDRIDAPQVRVVTGQARTSQVWSAARIQASTIRSGRMDP